MILGFTGTFGAGKGTVIEIIARDHGALVFSLSDEIRAECRKRGLGVERENLLKVGNGMRKRHGGGYWAKKVAEKVKAKIKDWKTKLICIDSIRAPEEVEELRRQFGNVFRLVAVDAPIEVRYKRIKKRARAGENVLSFEEFKASEEREQSKAQNEASIWRTMGKADITIENIESEEKLKQKINKIIENNSKN